MPAPVDQSEFDFLIGSHKPLLRPEEVARCLGRSMDFVYSMIQEGRLEAHAPKDREKARYTITRRSVILLMAEQANYTPGDFLARLEELLGTLSRSQLIALQAILTRQLARSL